MPVLWCSVCGRANSAQSVMCKFCGSVVNEKRAIQIAIDNGDPTVDEIYAMAKLLRENRVQCNICNVTIQKGSRCEPCKKKAENESKMKHRMRNKAESLLELEEDDEYGEM